MSDISVILYSLILGIFTLSLFIKYKTVNVTTTCISLYFVSALTSIYFFYNSNYDYSSITIVPILYVLICILITFIPIVKYDNVASKGLAICSGSTKFIQLAIIFFSLLAIEPFIENLIHLPSVFGNQDSLGKIYDEKGEDYRKYEYLSWIGRKFFWINYLLRDIIAILLFYYISTEKKLDKKILVGLSMGILNPIIQSFAQAGRSGIINSIFYIIFVYVLFRPYINRERRSFIERFLLFLGGGIIMLIAIVTVTRYVYSSLSIGMDMWTWITLYTGEGVLNFCNDLWPVEKTCNGDNTFLFIRHILGLADGTDMESIRATRNALGVRTVVFYTYIGTIYYDFNKIGTLIFISLFSLLFCKITKFNKSKIRLSQLIYLSILGKVIMMGVMFYPYSIWSDQLSLFLVLIFTWILSIKERNVTRW